MAPDVINGVVQNYCARNLITFDATRPPPRLDPDPPAGYSQNAAFGDELTVRVTYRYRFLVIPRIIVDLFRGPNISQNGEFLLVAETVMRYE